MSRRTRRLPGLAAVPLLIVLVGCGVGLAREESGTLPVAPPAAQTSLVSSLPSGFVHETVFGGLFLPTAVAFLPNGAILIATKPGLVYLYVDGALAEAPLLDISDRVNDFVDRGLLSLAVDPDFETNGYLYLLYTFDADPEDYEGAKVSRLGRFTVEGRLASPASEVVLLGTAGTESCSSVAAGADCLPSDGRSHTVGDLQFASDGSIFLTVGDGASDVLVNDDPFRAQDLDLLAGKLLRITKEGKGLPDNPFWNGDADANRSKVWASGLRNAYRFHLQSGTDQPFLGDVGEGAWEEINAPSAGANLGWPCYEGPVLQARYESHDDCRALYAAGTEVTFPVLSVGHEGAARAITAGPFYAGVTFPAAFHGAMFFGDVIEGSIDFILVNGENELVDGPIRFFDGADGADGPVDIAVGPDGSLYYVSIFTGEVRRIRYLAPPPHQPVVLGGHAWSAASNGSDAITVRRPQGARRQHERSHGRGGVLRARAWRPMRPQRSATTSAVTARPSTRRSGSTIWRAAVGRSPSSSGTVTAESPTAAILRGQSAPHTIDASIAGVTRLVLRVTDAGDGNALDYANWGGARLVCGPDATAPSVAARGATHALTVTFSEPMDASGFGPESLRLVVLGSHETVVASPRYDADARALSLELEEPLAPDAVYELTLAGGEGGVVDFGGNPLPSDIAWRVSTASDGTLLVGEGNSFPRLTIDQPAHQSVYAEGEAVTLVGSGVDLEDGSVGGESLEWSSSRDGTLGRGTELVRADLSAGVHRITLAAQDAAGAEASAVISVTIEPVSVSPLGAYLVLIAGIVGLLVIVGRVAGAIWLRSR